MSFWMDEFHDNTRAPYVVCSLLGCECGLHPECVRCGAELYNDPDFIEQGILWAMWGWWRWNVWRNWVPVRCQVCRKITGYGETAFPVCDEHAEDWIPF